MGSDLSESDSTAENHVSHDEHCTSSYLESVVDAYCTAPVSVSSKKMS